MKMFCLFLVCSCATVVADVRLPGVIADHMVLQRDLPVRLWGWAEAGEQVTVSARDREAVAVADADGVWAVQFAPMAATAEPFRITFTGTNEVVIEDVVVGEVWLCTGQSNMGTPLGSAERIDDILAASDTPAIRLCRIPNTGAGVPAPDVETNWALSTADLAGRFSAVGYVFGYELQQALDVPVGLIQSQWGGTTVEAWIPREFMLPVPDLAAQLEEFEAEADEGAPGWRDRERSAELMDQSIAEHREWGQTMRAWQKAAAAAKKAGGKAPERPTRNRPPIHKRSPTMLYNGMIAPLTPMTVRGAIWYQGEANRPRGFEYRDGLRQLIAGWRANFDLGDFPFLVVQLPANGKPTKDAGAETGWTVLRESQWIQPQYQPNVATTVNYDINPDGNLHPTDKRPVGHRLALAALGMVYDRDVVWRSPSIDTITFGKGQVTLTFQDVADGLQTRDGKAPAGFSVAGADGDFVWATGRITAPDTVVVETPEIAAPGVIRYAWVENPIDANLVNSAGLPAAPFRGDAPPVE